MGLGADILNVHAGGGFTMMRKSAAMVREEAARRGIQPPKIIAVTILTSINETDWEKLGQTAPIRSVVLRLARLTQKAGLDGVVASPQEAALIREACGDDFLIVTPGVRPAGSSVDDQSRIATPASALQAGASKLVIGRPIRAAGDPRAAALAIIEEMKNH